MRKLFAVFMCLLIVISLGACSTKKEEPAGTGEKVVNKIAVVLPGSVTDESWNQSAFEGLKVMEEEGYETAYTENVDVTDAESVMRNYCTEGYDFIIAHGAQYGQAVCNVAIDFIDVKFFVTGNAPEDILENDLPKNILFADYRECEGSYVAGVLAALMTKTGKVGYIGGGNNTTQQSDKNAFIEGVKATNENVEISTVITGTFDDSTLGYETAKAMHESGVDVILQTCDHTGLGALQYCSENDVWCIGYTSDQSELVKEGLMLTSMLIDIPYMISSQLDSIAVGTFGGQSFPGLHDGVVSLSPFSEAVPKDVSEKVATVIDKIVTGELEIVPNYGE